MPIYSATTEGEETLTTSAETLVALISATTCKPKIVEWGVAVLIYFSREVQT